MKQMLNYLLPCNSLQVNIQTGFNFLKIDKPGQEMSNYILVIFPYINTFCWNRFDNVVNNRTCERLDQEMLAKYKIILIKHGYVLHLF